MSNELSTGGSFDSYLHNRIREQAMNIGGAVAALRLGYRVARAGWNGKNMWLSLTPSNRIEAHKFWSGHNRKFAEENGGTAVVREYVTMKTADGEIVPWVCSQTDLLAEDWELVS